MYIHTKETGHMAVYRFHTWIGDINIQIFAYIIYIDILQCEYKYTWKWMIHLNITYGSVM